MKFQRGGFAVGLVVGLLAGLVLALGVALYVTKVPVPFVNKLTQRSAEQDAAEAERNRKWDPNAPLSAKVAPPRATTPASPPLPASAAAAPATAPRPAPPELAAVAPPAAPAPAKPRTTGEAFTYFAQAGAYSRADDAQAQRAKLALIGLNAAIVEREQSGRTVYRVRLGPFEKRADAEAMLERLNAASVESSLVRVERQ